MRPAGALVEPASVKLAAHRHVDEGEDDGAVAPLLAMAAVCSAVGLAALERALTSYPS